MSRSPFDTLGDAYDAGRPTYPPAMYDALEEMARPLAGAEVVEVGAGITIATAALTGRGASVTAVDIGHEALTWLITRSAPPPGRLRAIVRARGNALPLRSASVDLVTFAQAFHWVQPAEAGAEVRRVLRPGGFLAAWWNHVDAEGEAWWIDQQERLAAANPRYDRKSAGGARLVAPLAEAGLVDVRYAEVAWVRSMSLKAYLMWLRSRRYVAELGPAEPAFVDAEEASLSEAFPDHVVREPFVTCLWVGRRR